MAEANYIDASQVHGEKFTGYEAPGGKGPFECGNCEYFKAGTCGNKVMMARSSQPRAADGRVKVDAHGCCEYVERVGRKTSVASEEPGNARSIFGSGR